MENITKGAVVLKAVPTAADMGLINAQSLRELKEEEIFTFRVAAADTQVDRDFERFSRPCLEKLAELYDEICAQYGEPHCAEADFTMTPQRKEKKKKRLSPMPSDIPWWMI